MLAVRRDHATLIDLPPLLMTWQGRTRCKVSVLTRRALGRRKISYLMTCARWDEDEIAHDLLADEYWERRRAKLIRSSNVSLKVKLLT